MKEIILIVCLWVHIVATTLWIGGIFFILFISIPSSRRIMGAESGKLMAEVSKRFTPLANISIILLAITGGILLVLSEEPVGTVFFDGNRSIALITKLFLFSGMAVIHFYRGLVLTPKIIRSAETEKAALQKLSINLVKVNFFLGLLILLFSGAVSVFRQY